MNIFVALGYALFAAMLLGFITFLKRATKDEL